MPEELCQVSPKSHYALCTRCQAYLTLGVDFTLATHTARIIMLRVATFAACTVHTAGFAESKLPTYGQN